MPSDTSPYSPAPPPAGPPTTSITAAARILGNVALAIAVCCAGGAVAMWIAEATYDGDSLGVGYLLAVVLAILAAATGLGGALGLVLARRHPRAAVTLAAIGLSVMLLPVLFFVTPLPFW